MALVRNPPQSLPAMHPASVPLSLLLAASFCPVYAASVPLLFLSPLRAADTHPELSPGATDTLMAIWERPGKLLSVYPSVRNPSAIVPLPRPHHCSFTAALLLFGATLTIIVVTIRQRRRKRQQAEQPDFSYASHLPPKFLPSMPYGISRVSRSDGPSDSLGSYRYPLAAQFSVPTSSQVRSEEFS